MSEPPIFSADSHVVEPPEVFAGLAERFGDRAPRVVTDPPGREGICLVWPKEGLTMSVGRFGIAGQRLDDPRTQENMKRGWEGMNPGVHDPAARLREQDQDGVAGEVLYPSLNMFTFSVTDREVAQAVFQRHNDWLLDCTSLAPERLVGVACLPLPDVDAAIQELLRTAKRGMRAFAIPCTAPPDQPYSDPAYEPFWAAAEEVGRPLSMHIFCGAVWGMGLPAHFNAISSYALADAAICWTMETLITSGVLERHPGLRFVCCEFETGWLAHWLHRLDHATYRTPQAAVSTLQMPPSDYWRRQFVATFEDDPIGVRTRDLIGVDNLLWGNDYPHHDSIWPNSRRVLAEVMDRVPEPERRKMTWDSARRLYDIADPPPRDAARGP